MDDRIESCWIVTEDGLTGTENQCLGVADALDIIPVIKRIGLKQPWKSLSPYIGCENAASFTGDSLTSPWPDLLISAGRKAIAASRYIKKMSHGQCFTVHIQDPHINPKHFDLVAVPTHDKLRGENVIVTTATPNRISASKLTAARQAFEPIFSQLDTPRVAVLIGGNSASYHLTPEILQRVISDLKDLSNRGFSLMVTTSRRTGQQNINYIQDQLHGDNNFIWDGTGDNPYFGLLAWADYIIVTSDSASMISDACSTGKPVYMIPLKGGSAKFNRLHNLLRQNGQIRDFNGRLQPFRYTHLNDAQYIADRIRKALESCV